MADNKQQPLPIDRAPADTPFDALTDAQQEQRMRDSIPHDEHVTEGYWAVGCNECATEQMADAAKHG